MRIAVQVILILEIIVLCVCVHFARRSDIYFIGMDLIMACLLKFTLNYCYYSWDNKVLINFVYSLLGIDIIQLLLNPFFGHAFAAEELEAGGLPYFRVVPYAGQIYHNPFTYCRGLLSIRP